MERSAEDLIRRAETGDAEAAEQLGEGYLHGALGQPDYGRAWRWSKIAAEAGRARARTNLGICCLEGYHVPQDLAAARRYFEEAAGMGDMKAPRYLGILLRDGRCGGGRDEEGALEWFRLGAERGDITSQYFLGEMYEMGLGTKKDMGQALAWYRKSAARGDKIAEPAMLALKRLEDKGVTPSGF